MTTDTSTEKSQIENTPSACMELVLGQADQKSVARLRTERADDEIRDHVRMLPGPQPYKHNYYTSDQFFVPSPQVGQIKNVYGQRVVRVTEDFITGMLAGLEDETGDRAGELMYATGFQWGLADMKRFVPRVQSEFESDFKKMGTGMLLETWWWPLTIEGWGTWHFDFREAKRDMIFIELYESAVAKTLGDIGEVVCYFYAGMFASVFSMLSRKDFGCVEIQCYAMGADHCKFLISHEERVDSAAFWRNQGASGNEILKKID